MVITRGVGSIGERARRPHRAVAAGAQGRWARRGGVWPRAAIGRASRSGARALRARRRAWAAAIDPYDRPKASSMCAAPRRAGSEGLKAAGGEARRRELRARFRESAPQTHPSPSATPRRCPRARNAITQAQGAPARRDAQKSRPRRSRAGGRAGRVITTTTRRRWSEEPSRGRRTPPDPPAAARRPHVRSGARRDPAPRRFSARRRRGLAPERCGR